MRPACGELGRLVQDLLVQPLVMDAHVRDLRYFVAVAEAGSFTAAADTTVPVMMNGDSS